MDNDLWERVGGEAPVRAVVARFVGRMAADPIIGFFFAGKDLDGVVQHEYEHAARVLGGPVAYTGRPIPELHRALRINNGQFRRRLALLRQELGREGIPADISGVWIEAQERMQRMITDGTDCAPPVSGQRGSDDAPGR